MRSNFDASLDFVFKVEGYYVNDPMDNGGATKFGITIGTLSRWVHRECTPADVRDLSRTTAAAIYRNNYWALAHCDDLPAGVDLAVFDFAVNSGVRTAIKALQRVVGVKDDGYIGALTLHAVVTGDPKVIIGRLCAGRLGFMHRLRSWKRFGTGWTNRVNKVRFASIKMVVTS